MLPTGLVEAVIVVGLHQAGDQLGKVLPSVKTEKE